MNNETNTDTFEIFNEGFADATGSTLSEARDSWAWYSRQLSDSERNQIEARGSDAGWAEGNRYCLDKNFL